MYFYNWKAQHKSEGLVKSHIEKMWNRKPSTDMKIKLEETQKRIRHWWKDSKDSGKGKMSKMDDIKRRYWILHTENDS